MNNPLSTDKRIETLQKLAGMSGVRNAAQFVDLASFCQNQRFIATLENYFAKMAATGNVDIDPAFLVGGPRPEDLPENGLIIGSLPQYPDSVVRHPIQHTDAGILISGRSGSGKSFLVSDICEQLLNDPGNGVRVLIFDSKGEYQNLLAKHIRSSRLWVLDYKQYRRNLLEVLDGEEPLEAINRITDLLWSNSIYLRHGTTNLIADLIKDMYEERGVFAGSNDYPALVHANERLSRMRFRATSRYSGYQESGISRMKNLLNQMHDTLNCIRGHSIHQILDNNIVLRVRGLSDVLYKIVVEDLLRCILQIRSSYPAEGIKNLIIIDEAHLLLSGSSSIQEKGEDFLIRFARLCRSSGCDLLISDQTPSLIQSAVLANMSTRIAMQIVNGPCVRRIAESMSLSQEQAEALPRLKPRQAVMHFTGFPDSAFLIQIPELDFGNKMNDEEVNEIMSPVLAKLEWTPISLLNPGLTQPETSQPSYQQTKLQLEKPTDSENSMSPALKEDALKYLEALGNNPFTPVTELDRKLKISLRKGHDLRDKLESESYMKIHRISTGSRSGLVSIVELTDKAYDYLKAAGGKLAKNPGIGSFLHCFWQHQIQKWYAAKFKDCKAIIEDTTFGKRVDIGIHLAQTKTAVEILIEGEQKEVTNIEKDLEHYDEVICCCQDIKSLKSLREKVEREFDDAILMRVSFKLLGDFYLSDASPSPSASGSVDVETDGENPMGFPKPE
jgi:hypothetical protein